MGSSARSSDPLGYQAATPGRDPEEAAVEDARVMSSPARVNDTSNWHGTADKTGTRGTAGDSALQETIRNVVG